MATKKRAARKPAKREGRELSAEERELLEEGGWEQVGGGVGEPWHDDMAVAGVFVAITDSTFQQDDGEFAKLVSVETETGVRTFRCPDILFRRMETLNNGDEVRITCHGKIRTKAGRNAWDFTVLTKRHSPAKARADVPPTKRVPKKRAAKKK